MFRLLLSVILVFATSAAFAAEVKIGDIVFKAQVPPADWLNNRNCGPAAAYMVASFYRDETPTTDGLTATVDWLYDQGYVQPQSGAEYYDGNYTNTGILIKLLEDYFGQKGIIKKNENNLVYLREAVARRAPVIVAVNVNMNPSMIGHFMVVVGVSDTEIIVHDPGKTAGAFNRYGLSAFASSWATSNYASLVVSAPSVLWHPNGTLLKAGGAVYQLISNQKYRVASDAVFAAHDFDPRRVLTVSQDELDCYNNGGVIDWSPYREVFQVGATLYMLEKNSAAATTCTYYRFASRLAFDSWTMTDVPTPISEQTARSLYFDQCEDGGDLHIRDGSLVKPSFAPDSYGEGVVFVAENRGMLRAFETYGVFTDMGYGRLPLLRTDSAEEFDASFLSYGNLITAELASQCLNGSHDDTGGGVEQSDLDNDGFAVGAGDCDDLNDAIFPGAAEICNGLDDNCDGRVDEDVCAEPDGDADEPDGDADEPAEEECETGQRHCACYPNNTCNLALICVDGICEPDPVENDDDDDATGSAEVECHVSCPTDYRAYAWWGTDMSVFGQSVIVRATEEEICERGWPWLDFNCACLVPAEWFCHDYTLASVSCNRAHTVRAGIVDADGEGEIWFNDFTCR